MKKQLITVLAIIMVSALFITGAALATNQEKLSVGTTGNAAQNANATAEPSARAVDGGKKNIVIIGTGGTIAGTGTPGKVMGYKPGVLDVEAIIEGVQGIDALANITGEQMLSIASDDITAEDWLALAKRINELSQSAAIDGFVITHGTDTLEETAYFLTLTVKTDKPIVLVGAARPKTALSADGPLNLYQAVAVAASDDAAGKGVLAVFAGEIFTAREVSKTSTFKTACFGSGDLGSIGYVFDDQVFFHQQSIKPHTTQTPFDISALEHLAKVGIAYFHADADVNMLEYMINNNDGLVIACAGNGGYSSAWIEKTTQTLDIPIVRSSRIANGIVMEDPDVAPTISANNLNPQKARILLQLALSETKDINEIAKYFEEY